MTESSRRTLGCDLGIKRTGLAICDELGIAVRGLPNRIPKSRTQDVDFLLDVCRTHDVVNVVIGLPRMPRSGDEGPMAKRCRGFAQALADTAVRREVALAVYLLDETMSSKAAAARLVETGVKKAKRREILDAEVACGLVERFLAGDDVECMVPAPRPSGDVVV